MRVKKWIAYIVILLVLTNIFALTQNGNAQRNQIIKYTMPVLNNSGEDVFINDFANFSLGIDYPNIESINSISELNFSYLGETSESNISEMYNATFLNGYNITDFSLEFDIDYSFNDTKSMGEFNITLWSQYDSFENNNYSKIACLGIKDNNSTSTGNYYLAGYPLDFEEYYTTENNTLLLNNQLKFFMNRTDNELYIQIKNSTDNNLLDHQWFWGVNKSLTEIQLTFTSGGFDSNFNISLTNPSIYLKKEYISDPPEIIETYTFDNFTDFEIIYNESSIESDLSASGLNISYNGGALLNNIVEYYYFPLDEVGNCTNFDISLDIFYNGSYSTTFGRIQLILASSYNEYGDFRGPSFDNKIDVCHLSVQDIYTSLDGEFEYGATPEDANVVSKALINTIGSTGNYSFSINRTSSIINFKVFDYENESEIVNQNIQPVVKPVNYIVIGSYLYSNSVTNMSIRFSNINATLEIGTPEFLTEIVPSQNDAGTGEDAPDNFADALAIGIGSVQGTLLEGDNDDYYKVYLGANVNIQISMTGDASTDFDLYLYNPYNSLQTSSTYSTSSETIDYDVYTTGYWRICVHRYSGYGNYSLSITTSIITTQDPQNDGGSGQDAGDTINTATYIQTGTHGNCYLGVGDRNDYYQFFVNEKCNVEITVEGPYNADFDLMLYDPANNYISGSSNSGSDEYCESYAEDFFGYYKIRVYTSTSSGYYQLTVTLNTNYTPSSPVSYGVWIAIGLIVLIGIIVVSVYFGTSSKRKESVPKDDILDFTIEEDGETVTTQRKYLFFSDEESTGLPDYEEVCEDVDQHQKEIIDTIYKGYLFDWKEDKKNGYNNEKEEY